MEKSVSDKSACIEASNRPSVKAHRYLQVMGWVIGLGCLYIFFGYFFDWATFKENIRQAEHWLLFLSGCSFLIGILVRSVRWSYMVRCCWPELGWMQGVFTVLCSNMVNFLFPVRLGEVFKLVIVRKTFGISYSASTSASIVEKLTLFLIMLFVLALTPFAGYHFSNWSARFFPFLLLLLAMSAGIFFFGVKGLKTSIAWGEVVLRKIGLKPERVELLLRNRLTRFAEDTLRQCHAKSYSVWQFITAGVMGVLILALDGLTNYLLLNAFGLELSFLQAVIAACFFNMLFLLPSPPVQVGTAEMYPLLIYSGGLKLPAVVVASSAIIWHMLSAGLIILLGILSFYAIGLRLASVMVLAGESKNENHGIR